MAGGSQFAGLARLSEEAAQEAQAGRKKPRALPAAGFEGELPPLPEPKAESGVVMRQFSASIPESVKLDFDDRILDARRRYFGDLEVREGFVALITLLRDDERVQRLWLAEIQKGRGD